MTPSDPNDSTGDRQAERIHWAYGAVEGDPVFPGCDCEPYEETRDGFCIRCESFPHRADSCPCSQCDTRRAKTSIRLLRTGWENVTVKPEQVETEHRPTTQWWETPPDLDNLPEPAPALLTRSDGATVIPDGRKTTIYGKPGGGKTWLALMTIAATLHRGGRVVLWDWESNPIDTFLRLRTLGVYTQAADPDRFRYVTGPRLAGRVRDAVTWLTEHDGPAVVVIDSVNKSGGGSTHDADYYDWLGRTVTPFRTGGITIIDVDHDTKNRNPDRNYDGPKNSGSKTAEADLILKITGTAWTKEQAGTVTAVKVKDRYSDLPYATDGQPVAKITVDDPAGQFDWKIDLPGSAARTNAIEQRIERDILEHLADHPDGRTLRQLRDAVKGRAGTVGVVADRLTFTGEVEKTTGPRSAIIYRITGQGQLEIGRTEPLQLLEGLEP